MSDPDCTIDSTFDENDPVRVPTINSTFDENDPVRVPTIDSTFDDEDDPVRPTIDSTLDSDDSVRREGRFEVVSVDVGESIVWTAGSDSATPLNSAECPASPKRKLEASHLIESEHIEYIEKIGSGAFGVVWRGRVFGQEVALKKIRLDSGFDTSQAYVDEVEIMRHVHHPNILELLGVCLEPSHVCLISEMHSSSLRDLIKAKHKAGTRFELKTILKYALDIARGLSWLHHQGIIHRDLKPGNIFISNTKTARIGDFGLAHFKRHNLARPTTIFYGLCGTFTYIAPEVMRREAYGVESDVFSFAMILCELCEGQFPFDKPPYSEAETIKEAILTGFRPTMTDNVHPEIRQIVRDCWHQKPKERPHMRGVYERLEEIYNTHKSKHRRMSTDEVVDELAKEKKRVSELEIQLQEKLRLIENTQRALQEEQAARHMAIEALGNKRHSVRIDEAEDEEEERKDSLETENPEGNSGIVRKKNLLRPTAKQRNRSIMKKRSNSAVPYYNTQTL